nr:universal stress protein [Flavobacterium davisii]
MKRILVPTDFSQHAEYALKVAAQFARKHNAEIYLIHLLELPDKEMIQLLMVMIFLKSSFSKMR